MFRVVLCIVSFCCAAELLACRFNVRDVGFVDLGSHDYELVCWVDSTVPASQRSQMRNIGLAALMDCNIKIVVREFDGESDRPATEFPAAILHDPAGLPFPEPLFQGPPNDDLWDALESVVTSPARDRIVQAILDSYGAVVFIPGTDPDENERVRGAAESAIAAVSRGVVQKTLEKDIENPPGLFEIARPELLKERVFLWSLGISPEETRPQIAMLYGRGRQIGRTMTGSEISYLSIFQVLNTIGLSCECGLDRSWMQGAMIPIRWDTSTQTRIAKDLGFDPESPDIKIEMSQILAKSAQAQRLRKERSSLVDAAPREETLTDPLGSQSPAAHTVTENGGTGNGAQLAVGSRIEPAGIVAEGETNGAEDVSVVQSTQEIENSPWALWIGVPVSLLLVGGLALLVRASTRKS